MSSKFIKFNKYLINPRFIKFIKIDKNYAPSTYRLEIIMDDTEITKIDAPEIINDEMERLSTLLLCDSKDSKIREKKLKQLTGGAITY